MVKKFKTPVPYTAMFGSYIDGSDAGCSKIDF